MYHPSDRYTCRKFDRYVAEETKDLQANLPFTATGFRQWEAFRVREKEIRKLVDPRTTCVVSRPLWGSAVDPSDWAGQRSGQNRAGTLDDAVGGPE